MKASCAIIVPMETVFVAMSGGLDSSYAAYLLKEQGYRVVGVTFQLLPASLKDPRNPKACCSLDSIEKARRVADHLSIPHYVLNLRREFETLVIQRFVDEYRAGRTPNPCVLCNRYIKFSIFAHKAFSMGAEKIATGHYAIIEETGGLHSLRKGVDKTKDQSYFLYPLPSDLMGSVLFPLGCLTKDKLRRQSDRIGWQAGTGIESQDICFIPEGNYRDFLSPFVPLREGPIYLSDGTRMGTHKGVHLYTIGQRRGLNIPFSEPLYVVDIKPTENILIVGKKDELESRRLTARDLTIHSSGTGSAMGRVRYRQKEAACSYVIAGDTLEVTFAEPLSSVTPGQSVVLYDGDRVLCGGTIAETGE
jgi:tRNA-uridine 2-sulfurtransferase